jgi:enamine deaminase RidA (YjgF/YER057c/UK114 family)
MPKTFFVYLPTTEGSFEEEWKQCLDRILNACSAGFSPVKLNIFADLPDFETFLQKRTLILQSAGKSLTDYIPAINISVHPPEKPWKISVEATFITSGSMKITGKFYNEIPYVILESGDWKEIWAGGVSSYSFPEDTRTAAGKAFGLMHSILEKEQMSMNNLVRQWNYIGNILAINDGFQNYQVFNEVRNDYYSRLRTIHGFPAATGVGMKHGGVILDFCALEAGESGIIKPVENPNQVNAYEYDQQVLKGLINNGKSVKHPPQFERALLIAGNPGPLLHISGTASITGQETIGKEDVEKQTLVTIGNIRKLTDPLRISKLLSGSENYREQFSLLRVYIKKEDEFRIVKRICEEHFPGIPSVFIEADICRDDLLMEIEAEVELKL